MVALKTHKTLQHVSIHLSIIIRELVCSLLKSMIKTVGSQICGNAAAYRRVCVRAHTPYNHQKFDFLQF
jgi:hypothetical protein